VVLAVALGVRLTGPQVLARFMTSFAEEGERDYSAESRLKLWQDCLITMARNPLVGVGPRQWGFVAPQFGWPRGKSAHSYWLQIGAEQGVPAFTFLVLFYLFAMWRALQLTRSPDKWLSTVGCMSLTSLAGFAFSAQFVTVEGMEIPYFVALFCLSASRLQETGELAAAPKPMPKPQTISHQWAGPRSARPATREAR
jgi:O-antigen ligase